MRSCNSMLDAPLRNAIRYLEGAWSGKIRVRSSNAASGMSRRINRSVARMTTVAATAIARNRTSTSRVFEPGGTSWASR